MANPKITSFGDIYKDKLAEDEVDTLKALSRALNEEDLEEEDLDEMLGFDELSGPEGSQATVEVTLHNNDGSVRERRFDSKEPVLEIDDDKVTSVAEALAKSDAKSIEEVVKTATPIITSDNNTLLVLEALLKSVNKLCNKIDHMVLTPPTIHVPAPIIEVTLPDIKRTVLKEVVREKTENGKTGVIDHVIETTTDQVIGKATAQILRSNPRKTVKKKG